MKFEKFVFNHYIHVAKICFLYFRKEQVRLMIPFYLSSHLLNSDKYELQRFMRFKVSQNYFYCNYSCFCLNQDHRWPQDSLMKMSMYDQFAFLFCLTVFFFLFSVIESVVNPNRNPFTVPQDNDVFMLRDKERQRKKQVETPLCCAPNFKVTDMWSFLKMITFCFGCECLAQFQIKVVFRGFKQHFFGWY